MTHTHLLLFFFICTFSLLHCLVIIRETNVTFMAVPCNASVFNGQPIYKFGNVTGRLVFQNATSLEKTGAIILIEHIDPIDETIEKWVGDAVGVIGIITVGLEEIPGKGFLETTFKSVIPYPWVDMRKSDGPKIIPSAIRQNITVFFDDTEINRWKQFVDTPVVIIEQILIFAANLTICILSVYLVLIISQLKKNPLHLINIFSEFLGAIARLIYFTDPMSSYRVINSSLNIGIFVFMFPFGLINCLLLSLYFQETMRLKDIKIFTYIRKTQWIFYTACILIVVALIFVPITRATTFYDTYRLIVVILIAVIAAAIAIFFIISSVQILDTLKRLQGKASTQSKRKQLSIRIIVTASCLFVMVILFFITRATFLRSPAGYSISITIAALSVSVVGIFSLVSLIVINSKQATTSTSTRKTKQNTRSMGGNTKDNDKSEELESEKSGDGDGSGLDDGSDKVGGSDKPISGDKVGSGDGSDSDKS